MGSSHLVFTYGTLKKNEPNELYLSEPKEGTAQYLGRARTVKKYPLVVTSEYNVPFVLREEGTGMEVEGEVYEVDDIVLASLDVLEGHPEMYRREEVAVRLYQGIDNKPIDPPVEKTCWIYFLHDYKKDLLHLKFYPCYHSISDDYGLYVPQAKRKNNRRIPREQIKENP